MELKELGELKQKLHIVQNGNADEKDIIIAAHPYFQEDELEFIMEDFNSQICEFEENLSELLRELQEERRDVDESIIFLIRSPLVRGGSFISPSDKFMISDKKTGNILAIIKEMEIFTLWPKNRNRIYIIGRMRNRKYPRIFKGSEIKIMKSRKQ